MTTNALPKRDEMARGSTWDLEAVYSSRDQWENDFQSVKQQIPKLSSFAGTLGDSAGQLLACLRLRDSTTMLLEQVLVYARMKKDEDNGNNESQALADRAMILATELSSATSFITPEILAISEERLSSFVAEEPELGVYRHYLDQLARQRSHVRSAEVEMVLAQSAEVSRVSHESFSMLTNVDIKFPVIEDESGKQVELSQGRYSQLRESPNREVRQRAFEALHSTFGAYRNTIASSLAGSVRSDIFYAKARNYGTALEAALGPNNIPPAVYHNLVQTVNANLPILHRYVQLRKRLLGLDELHHWDLYVPLVADVQMEIPYEEAARMVLAGLEPMGHEYLDVVKKALSSRWVDVYENEGKTSGAYSGGAYTTNPYILMNYQGTLTDVFTLAHEMGHSMHSYFTRGSQPYVYGDYTIFVAEVASTLNEALLTNHLLKQSTDPRLRAYLVNQYLERFRTTLFRQSMFAEFELEIHTRAENGQSLTPDSLSALYADLNARYYGPDVVQDKGIAVEWARIPHFFWAFYVYQYATGISAAAALARQIVEEGEPAVQRYLRFLKSGSSRYSIDLLRDAGVDMASPRPVEEAIAVFDNLLDEMERL